MSSVVVASASIFSASYSGVTAEAKSETVIDDSVQILLGDADLDGKVTILDATAIQKKLATIPVPLFSEAAADADEDTKLTVLDATAIQKHLAHVPTNENIGKPMKTV